MRRLVVVIGIGLGFFGCAQDDVDALEGRPAGPELDDEFDADLAGWTELNPEAARAEVSGGSLRIEPSANSLWFNARAGYLLHKVVVGDFVMTASVEARRSSDDSLPPEPQFRLGGLMARDGVRPENYVFIVVGADGDNVSVETKNTRDSQSQFEGPAWPAGAGELRICRVGASLSLLLRDSASAQWVEQANFDRPDLPDALQVGPMGYANNADPDLRVRFDYVRFGGAMGPEDCTR